MSDARLLRLRWRITVLGAFALLTVLTLVACGGDDGESSGGEDVGGQVAFLLPDNTTSRWEDQDKPFLTEAMRKYAPKAELAVSNAVNDPERQRQQAEAALTKGAKMLIVVSVDPSSSAAIAQAAKRENVPVLAYTRPINDAPVDWYVSVDPKEVGAFQGEWLADNTDDGDNIAVINGSPDDRTQNFSGMAT